MPGSLKVVVPASAVSTMVVVIVHVVTEPAGVEVAVERRSQLPGPTQTRADMGWDSKQSPRYGHKTWRVWLPSTPHGAVHAPHSPVSQMHLCPWQGLDDSGGVPSQP